MRKHLILFILSFFSAQSFAGSCPDDSEPVKSVSADGTSAKAIVKRKAEVAAAKAKRIAEEAAKAAETKTADTEEQSVEDEIAAFEAELAAELGQ